MFEAIIACQSDRLVWWFGYLPKSLDMYLNFIQRMNFLKWKHLARNVSKTGSLALHPVFYALSLV